MPYEKFEGKGSWMTQGAFISVTTERSLILSRECYNKFFKGYSAVLYFYNPEKKLIGLKRLKENEEGSYAIRVTRKKNHIYVITANAFLHHYGIDYSERRKYEPTWNEAEGVVEIDLNKPL